MRRSQRVQDSLDHRPPVEVITIVSSDDGSPPQQSATTASHQDETIEQRMRRRNLSLERIIGAVKSDTGVLLVVKWRGLTELEKISLSDSRKLFPQQVLDFMFQRVKWTGQSGSISNRKRGRPSLSQPTNR